MIITYRDDRNFYPHPDHIRVHEISVPAFDLAGDPEAYPDAGEPWQPLKLYYVSWSIARVKALHEAYLDRGEESAYASLVRARLRHEPQRRVHDADRRRRLPAQAPRGAARAPHAGRSRTGTGCACPTTSSARCSRGRSTRSRVRSSTTACPRVSTKTTSSPACTSRRAAVNAPMIVEFVVAAGQEGTGPRLGAHRRRRASPSSGEGAPADAADVTLHRDTGRRAGAARRHARPLGRLHARPGEDGRRLRRAAAVPAADGGPGARRTASPTCSPADKRRARRHPGRTLLRSVGGQGCVSAMRVGTGAGVVVAQHAGDPGPERVLGGQRPTRPRPRTPG